MNWVVRRADEEKEKFSRLKIILACVGVAAVIMIVVTKSIVLPLLCVAVMILSTSEFFLGRKYSLDETEAKAGANEITWPSVKSVHVGEDQIYLSPFEAESKLDAFRGVKLNIQNVSKESVLDYIREHVGKDVRFLER